MCHDAGTGSLDICNRDTDLILDGLVLERVPEELMLNAKTRTANQQKLDKKKAQRMEMQSGRVHRLLEQETALHLEQRSRAQCGWRRGCLGKTRGRRAGQEERGHFRLALGTTQKYRVPPRAEGGGGKHEGDSGFFTFMC